MPSFAPIVAYSDVPAPGSHLDFEPVSLTGPLAVYSGVMLSADNAVIMRSADPDAGGGTQPPASGSSTSMAIPAALQPSLSISLNRPSKTSRVSKARLKLVIPKPVLDNGVATNVKDRETTVDITIMSSERAFPVERLQALEYLLSLLTNTPDVRAVLIDNKSIY